MAIIRTYGQKLLPKSWRPFFAGVYWWGRSYHCPVCGWHTRSFRAIPVDPLFKERCTRCDSFARHRFLWLYLKNRSNLFADRLKVLYFAAETCFSKRLSKLPHLEYTTADVGGGYTPGMETLDLMAIDKPDHSYDVVIAIHVLEHVEDDARALREVFRILRPGGWAILNPHMDLSLERTFEDPTVTSPEERERLFHQADHYRVYGRDIKERFEAAGFKVDADSYMDSLDRQTIEKCFLETPGVVFCCKKPL
jgi:SAM-dependent methyltransferase